MIKVKRIYEKPSEEDGLRILVDRLWPRGIKREDARVDLWLKEIAPSDELRRWFSHRSERWEGFKRKYKEELKGKKELIERIKELESKHGTVTLLFSARDTEHNNAVVLMEVIEEGSW
ncbi:uncharacterized protein YeaO (DUF488 family) [Hydrogenivirga caldilitoris]|uniref:Uncharacterized protein YeaO (DUF488 family) n=1 Tax=Hydrogenivirga caldilitoris TaxID=246264 RepID=A0A497XPG5_9AQUI|nr:DUF488 family protein [Hydrogenivirga caldilitoris]RLJ70876.1 uncharacterized protein YeaO (DUF488 family) [Hydrogenivirga caldilitoris]